MSHDNLYSVLIGPHISEKSSGLADKQRQFVFKVQCVATKPLIKQAVEHLFSVKVMSVRVANMPGKVKAQRGKTPGRRQDWKKAYVRLAPGQDIDFAGLGERK